MAIGKCTCNTLSLWEMSWPCMPAASLLARRKASQNPLSWQVAASPWCCPTVCFHFLCSPAPSLCTYQSALPLTRSGAHFAGIGSQLHVYSTRTGALLLCETVFHDGRRLHGIGSAATERGTLLVLHGDRQAQVLSGIYCTTPCCLQHPACPHSVRLCTWFSAFSWTLLSRSRRPPWRAMAAQSGLLRSATLVATTSGRWTRRWHGPGASVAPTLLWA